MKQDLLKRSFINQEQLPLIIEPNSKDQATEVFLINYLQNHRPQLKEDILNYGSVLFRGFHIDTTDKFNQVMAACELGFDSKYDVCPVPRKKLQEGVYTSAIFPPEFNLDLHNEKSYDRDFPTHVLFCCVIPPDKGGLTPLANANKVWTSLPTELQEKLKSKGIMYRKYYYGNGSLRKDLDKMTQWMTLWGWPEIFQTNNKNNVEKKIIEMGRTYKWTETDDLMTEIHLPAYRIHPKSQQVCWFNQGNQLNLYHNNVTEFIKILVTDNKAQTIILDPQRHPSLAFFGDGEMISKEESEQMNQAMKSNQVATPWQKGDFMIIDNYSCLHGKTPHSGQRLILAGMKRYPYNENAE